MSDTPTKVVEISPDDNHDRVVILFRDPDEDNRHYAISILHLLHNGPPINRDTNQELVYVATHFVH